MEKKNPRTEEDNNVTEYYKDMHATIDPNFKKEIKFINDIEKQLEYEKQGIFYNIAGRFRNIMKELLILQKEHENGLFSGKMSSFYFYDEEHFFEFFDFYSTPNPEKTKIWFAGRAREIYFDSFSALKGKYSLDFCSEREFQGWKSSNYHTMYLFSPVAFRIQFLGASTKIPSYVNLVKDEFEKIKADHPKRTIPELELTEWDMLLLMEKEKLDE